MAEGKSSSRSSGVLSVNSSDSDEYRDLDDSSTEEVEFDIGLEKLSLGPKKKLLVINISGFLLNKIRCRNKAEIRNAPNSGRRYGNFVLYKRPYCEEFLKLCFERFEVGVWSSALRHNVNNALSYVLGSHKGKLLFDWDQSNCTDSGFECPTNESKPLFLKELKMVWKEVKEPGLFSSKNTLLIDNEPDKALLNPPYTGIFPVPYDPSQNKADKFLDPKGGFWKYLEGLADAEDVQSYVKENPFGQPAISPNHPEWVFYSVVRFSL